MKGIHPTLILSTLLLGATGWAAPTPQTAPPSPVRAQSATSQPKLATREGRRRPGETPTDVNLGAYHDVATIRTEGPQGGSAEWISTGSTNFWNVPRMASSFVADEDDTNVSLTFSAEAFTSSPGTPLLIRVLLDGAMAAPGIVVFTDAAFQGARSFTFIADVDQGIHTAEVQWAIGSAVGSGHLRSTSLVVRKGLADSDDGTLTVTSAENETMTTGGGFSPVDSMQVPFYVPPGGETFLQFSSETRVLGDDKSLFVRATVDGQATQPGDVVFARTDDKQTHTMVFGAKDLAPGWHTASVEWTVTAGGIATVGDRTLSVASYPNGNGLTHKFFSPPSGPPISTNSTSFVPVPGLSSFAQLPRNAETTVLVSAEVFAFDATVSMRLRVGNEVSEAVEIVSDALPGTPLETQSFSFDVKHVFPQSAQVAMPIQLEWKVSDANALVALADRSMAVVIEEGAIPDLAEAQELGRLPIEPVIGTRKLLTILYNPHRPSEFGPVGNDLFTVNDMVNALYGPGGVSDYFLAISGGRFTIENAGVVGWYDAWRVDGEGNYDWEHYWDEDHANPDCDVLPDAEFNDGFRGGHKERLFEAITMAADDINIALYDTNGDGAIDWRNELGIMVVVPQWESFGQNANLIPLCPESTMTVQGVEIQVVTEWFTPLTSGQQPISFPWITAAHELAHNYLNLGDYYVEDYNTHTEPRQFSLMGNPEGRTTHIEAYGKLALGWGVPVPAHEAGLYELEDVRTSEEFLVLPRRLDGDGKEYFVFENRQDSLNDPLFDSGLGGSGVAVWHIIEEKAQFDHRPHCMTQQDWDMHTSGATRRGIRLLRASVTPAAVSAELFHDQQYDLFDSGFVCPVEDDSVEDRRNALRWADGTQSGYGVMNWSLPGPVMSCEVLVP